jgi:hypothetical protein
MTERLQRMIPVLITIAMACVGGRFACAQSESNSSMVSAYGLSGSEPHSASSLNGQAGPANSPGHETSGRSPKSGMTSGMASQWTAGAKSFGSASDQTWGNKNLSFDAGHGKAWHPGTDSFGAGPQPGGIWVVPGAQATGEESTPQNVSQRMIQAATGDLPNGFHSSTTPSAATGSFSAGRTSGLQPNHWVASATRSLSSRRAAGVSKQSQGPSGSRSVHGFGSFGGSSMGYSSRRSVGSFRSLSRSFGGVGRTRGRSTGSTRSRGSARASFSESFDQRSQSFDSLQDTEHLHPGLGDDFGSRNSRLGSRGKGSSVYKLGAGDRREPSGKSSSSQGLDTNRPH